MDITSKIKNFISPEEDDEEDMVDDLDRTQPISSFENKSSRVSAIPSGTAMALFEPRSFEDAEEIARQLVNHKATVVNLHKLQREYAQRTIDFLTGVVFALGGTIQKVGHNVILCAPKDIVVNGEIRVDSDE